MMVYRDRTFCTYSACDDWNICDRAFTKADEIDAKRFCLPVSFFFEAPKCFKVLKFNIDKMTKE